jgi:hypothetical protein
VDLSKAIEKITHLDPTSLVDQAYQGKGYIGLNMVTGATVENPSPTTIKLFEIAKDNKRSLEELRSYLWQNWRRFKVEIKERIKSFYDQNYIIA